MRIAKKCHCKLTPVTRASYQYVQAFAVSELERGFGNTGQLSLIQWHSSGAFVGGEAAFIRLPLCIAGKGPNELQRWSDVQWPAEQENTSVADGLFRCGMGTPGNACHTSRSRH